jgi:hypothetical protein
MIMGQALNPIIILNKNHRVRDIYHVEKNKLTHHSPTGTSIII